MSASLLANLWSYVVYGFIVVVALAVIWWATRRPRHDRVWEIGQERLPFVSIENGQVQISDLRDFDWTGPFAATVRYRTESFALFDLQGVELVVSHFSAIEGIAHFFVTFVLNDGRRICFSIETRRKHGESFSPLRGLFRAYELIMVMGTERDVVGVRVKQRNERVYRYRTPLSPEHTQRLFTILAGEVNKIYARPLFYNTITNNCVNLVTRSLSDVTRMHEPAFWYRLLPGYMHTALYHLALIDTSLPFEETKERARIHST